VFWLSLSPTTFYIIHFFCKIQDGLAFWYWLAQDVMELAIIAQFEQDKGLCTVQIAVCMLTGLQREFNCVKGNV